MTMTIDNIEINPIMHIGIIGAYVNVGNLNPRYIRGKKIFYFGTLTSGGSEIKFYDGLSKQKDLKFMIYNKIYIFKRGMSNDVFDCNENIFTNNSVGKSVVFYLME